MRLKPKGDRRWRPRAENRIAELEAEVQLYKAKMDRAKQWLHKLFSQIEERLLG